MRNCPSCKNTVTDDALTCSRCGMSFDDTSGATAILPSGKEDPSVHPVDSADGAQFAAGTLLAGRYRISSLLGRGGMGEVYKAEDIKLKQVVALKFLPEALAMDPASLARFNDEVRITRQISHPNVCRVYDIGETGGLHFLSMEFIDGENLSVLLSRIGRLPGEKANEIARQICAGLAAAHDNGVLHRDLKPANIMIDGRGKAHVADFGVAVVAKELLGADATSGTPAYMAPEQLQGKEVTQSSDIYSLGLVLYEIFTGRRVFNSDNLLELMSLHESSSPASPSSYIEHIDPLVERVIMRCLEKDPRKRPATAMQVAAALPGGDPLAAALAAGETPSPEMVAASGEKTGLRPAVAIALLCAIIIGLLAVALLGNKVDWAAQILRQNSPDALNQKARDIIQRLGYTDPPADTAAGLHVGPNYRQWAAQNSRNVDRWNQFLNIRPSPVYFWYRQSPRPLESEVFVDFGWVTETDPHYASASNMVSVDLDPAGRLTSLIAVPSQVELPAPETPSYNWSALFSAAGIDPASFAPTASTRTPLTVCDTRAAWEGFFPEQPDIPIRVEAAAYRGKPVYFGVIAPWDRAWLVEPERHTAGDYVSFAIANTMLAGALVFAGLLARNNLRRGRGDRRGAARLSIFVFLITLLAWTFGAAHTLTTFEIARFIFVALSQSLLLTGVVWLSYIALEPYVRRRWPETIVSWSRLLAGSLRDPLVGRDILIGVLAGITFLMVDPYLENLVRLWNGQSPATATNRLDALIGTRQLIGAVWFSQIDIAIANSLVLFFLVFVFRAITRRRWIAAALFVLIFTVLGVVREADPGAHTIPFQMLSQLLVVVVLMRYGLLTMTTAVFTALLLGTIPITTDISAWYAGYFVTTLAAILILSGWAFHTSLGGKRIFSGEFLGG